MSLQEDLKLIEEALEEIIESTPESRGPGLRGALDHDFHAIGRKMASGLASGIKKVSDKLQVGANQEQLKKHSAALNQAHADYETHKATGNQAGMAVAQNNIKHHTSQINNYANSIRNGGGTVSSTPTPAQQQQHAQQQQAAAQKKATAQAKKQAKAQQVAQKQTKSSITPGAQRSAQVAAARKSGNSAAVRNLANKFAEEDRRAAGTASEAYSLAESLIMSLLEGMENRNKGAIIKKTEIIKDGKPHVKGTFVETEIIKDAKGDIPNPKRERICKKASKKAEGAISAMKREVANEIKKLAGQEE